MIYTGVNLLDYNESYFPNEVLLAPGEKLHPLLLLVTHPELSALLLLLLFSLRALLPGTGGGLTLGPPVVCGLMQPHGLHWISTTPAFLGAHILGAGLPSDPHGKVSSCWKPLVLKQLPSEWRSRRFVYHIYNLWWRPTGKTCLPKHLLCLPRVFIWVGFTRQLTGSRKLLSFSVASVYPKGQAIESQESRAQRWWLQIL